MQQQIFGRAGRAAIYIHAAAEYAICMMMMPNAALSRAEAAKMTFSFLSRRSIHGGNGSAIWYGNGGGDAAFLAFRRGARAGSDRSSSVAACAYLGAEYVDRHRFLSVDAGFARRRYLVLFQCRRG